MRHKKLSFKGVAAIFAALTLLGQPLAPAAAQEQKPQVPPPAVRVLVRLVLVDAIVTEKDGKLVTGLGAQDFTVLEDGKPQKITNFSFEQPAELARALRSQISPLPQNVTTSRPAYRTPQGTPVILLIDALNTRATDQARLRMELLRYVNTQLQPGQQVAVYTLARSLRLLQDFTDDPRLLKAAIESFKPSVSRELQIADLNQRVPRLSGANPALDVQRSPRDPAVVLRLMEDFLTEQANVVLDERVGITLTAFRAIAQSVSGLPGRKSLIWVTGSFPLATYTRIIDNSANPNNDPNRVTFDKLYEDLVRETGSRLNDARVAVYPVDARGLIGQLLGGAEESGLTGGGTLMTGEEYAQNLSLAGRSLQETQATLTQFAGDTGGLVYKNQNDLDHAVALSVQDGASYYLLGYSPEGKPDGKLHKIEVKVNRAGVSVRARRGYYSGASGDSKAVKQREADVMMAMLPASPGATGITFDARVVPPAPAAKMKVGVDVLVDLTTLSSEDAGGGNRRLAVEFHVAAYTSDGKLAGQHDVAIKPTLKPADFTALQQQGIPHHAELELPPGRFSLRFGVVDQLTGVIGTADLALVLGGPK